MNELHLIFDSNTGLSLKDRIYKVREWAHIDNKKVSNSVDFSIRLSLLEKFSRHIIRLSAPPSPNIFSDDEEEKYEHMDMSLAMKRSNIFTTFSTILDIFLRAGRKQLKSILNDNFETWKELLQSLLYLICDCKNTLTQHAGTASLPYTCSYRPNDIHAVLKQLHILRSSRIFSTSDVDTWMTKCTLLLETNIKLPPALSSTFEEAAAAEDLRCSPLHKRDSSEKCNGDESSSILKKRKITTDCIVSTSIKDEPGGGLAVYRVCYLIEALSNGLKLPLVVTKLAQEIFHTFIILSKPSTSSLAMTTTTVTKTFASHKDSTAVKVGSSVDSNGAIDMTIRHFSATEDNASNDIISTFWQYDSECSTHLFRAERKCEQDFAAAAVAAIHLANKTILDTEDAYSSPRLHIILKELKRVLGSAHIRSLVFENPSNAFVYKADRFQDEIFTYEHLFLHRIQYDVSYWFGTITSTVLQLFI